MRKGFTLLEVILGMAVISILAGVGLFFIQTNHTQEAQTFSAALQQLAKETLHKSTKTKRPHRLIFEHNTIRQVSEYASHEQAKVALWIPKQVTLTLQRNDEAKGTEVHVDSSDSFTWAFSQSGICEPIILHIEHPNYAETLSFQPLTAGIQHDGT